MSSRASVRGNKIILNTEMIIVTTQGRIYIHLYPIYDSSAPN